MTTFQQTILFEVNRLRASHGLPPLTDYALITPKEFTNACDAAMSVHFGRHVRAFREKEAQSVRDYGHVT